MATTRQVKTIAGGDTMKRAEVVQTLLDANEVDAEVLSAIVESEGKGVFLVTPVIAKLIIQTKSNELYWKTKHRLFQDLWALVEVFRDDYPDPEIEEKLLDHLLPWYDADDLVRCNHVLRALRDHGSTHAIRLLSELLGEHKPKVQAKGVMTKAMTAANVEIDFEHSPLVVQVESEFCDLLADAIRQISKRAKNRYAAIAEAGGPSWVGGLPRIEGGVVHEMMHHKETAKGYQSSDARAALLHVRLAVETICKALCKQRGLSDPKKPIDKLMLGELLLLFRGEDALPSHIDPVAYSINKFCTTGVHHQGSGTIVISAQAMEVVLGLLDEFAEWFLQSQGLSHE